MQRLEPAGSPTSTTVEEVRFVVNGDGCAVMAHPLARLADVLRDSLGLTGTKIGCNAGDCGACTVLIDGRQACACLVAIGQISGRSVTTVEGLAKGGALSLLQRSFLATGAAQCGMCTPGMLMAGADLLARNGTPDQDAVLDALGGVLCRCTGYRKIVDAVLMAAAGGPSAAQASSPSGVGARSSRTDGVSRVTGTEQYAADRAPVDAVWLRVIRSPHERARFRFGSIAALLARHRGLVDVITAADVPENSFGIFPEVKDQPVLADGVVRCRGEAVLGLVGAYDVVAKINEAEIPIEWHPLTPQLEVHDALENTAQPIHEGCADNVLIRGRVAKGEAPAALGQADLVVDGTFTTGYVEHAYIEPEAGFAERVGDRLRVFSCTQTPYMDRDELARILRIHPQQVHVIPSAVGGGFGGKLDISIQPLLAVAAWKLNRPVKSVYTRPESMSSTTKRHPATIRARYGCDLSGALIGVDVEADFNTGAYASWGNTVANRVPIHASGPYFVPHVRAVTRAVYTNGPIGGAFRGFGVPQGTIAQEVLIDELAELAGFDSLEFRRRNALRAGLPTATGQVLAASCGIAACLDALKPRWVEARLEADGFNRQSAPAGRLAGARRGVGLAAMWYGIGNTVIANPSAMRIGLRRNGRLVLYNGAVDIGQGSSTILVQIVAEVLGVPVTAIDSVIGDTDLTEDAGKTSASRQTFVSGNAARLAAENLRTEMRRLAGASPGATIALEDGTLKVADQGAVRCIDLKVLPADERGDVAAGRGYFNPPTTPLDKDGQGDPYATYGFGAHLAELQVDLELGTVRMLRVTAAHDVGRAINPSLVEGQIHGGVAQGIGFALMEEYHSRKTDNLHDYLIPTAGDVPPIDVLLIEDPEPLGPFGAKGVAEHAIVPTAPAIMNAIRHACGVRLRQIPVTPDRLRAALLERHHE